MALWEKAENNSSDLGKPNCSVGLPKQPELNCLRSWRKKNCKKKWAQPSAFLFYLRHLLNFELKSLSVLYLLYSLLSNHLIEINALVSPEHITCNIPKLESIQMSSHLRMDEYTSCSHTVRCTRV